MPAAQDDIAYYKRRFADCMAQARNTTGSSSGYVYQELARLYREKLVALDAWPIPDEVGHRRG